MQSANILIVVALLTGAVGTGYDPNKVAAGMAVGTLLTSAAYLAFNYVLYGRFIVNWADVTLGSNQRKSPAYMTRCIYRVIELAQGDGGYLTTYESERWNTKIGALGLTLA
ncbi:hypothetical protein EDB19DRAFT_1833029 [Suillus lakei]|nr:hypothetical protein EDB19DRAFT_1833029 [Suillus lakei]